MSDVPVVTRRLAIAASVTLLLPFARKLLAADQKYKAPDGPKQPDPKQLEKAQSGFIYVEPLKSDPDAASDAPQKYQLKVARANDRDEWRQLPDNSFVITVKGQPEIKIPAYPDMVKVDAYTTKGTLDPELSTRIEGALDRWFGTPSPEANEKATSFLMEKRPAKGSPCLDLDTTIELGGMWKEVTEKLAAEKKARQATGMTPLPSSVKEGVAAIPPINQRISGTPLAGPAKQLIHQ